MTAPNELPVYQSPKTFSVSALRDYHRCGHYYRLRRVDKLPTEDSHHMAAGSLMHDAFYLAYANPVDTIDNGRFLKVSWEPHAKDTFTPERALNMFDLLWWDKDSDAVPTNLKDAFDLLRPTVDTPKNFRPGQKKALKGTTQRQLRHGWYDHYQQMLTDCLVKPFQHPVVDIERKVDYQLGGHPGVGYIDLVLQDEEDDGEIYVDLKTGYNKPTEVDIFFDEQFNTYYKTGPKDIWYYHMRSGEIIAVDQNLSLSEWFDGVAAETIKAIQAGYFPKRFSPDCVYCAYRTRCIGI